MLFQRGIRVYPLLLKQAGKMIEKPGLRVIPIFVQADTEGVAQAIQECHFGGCDTVVNQIITVATQQTWCGGHGRPETAVHILTPAALA